MPGDASRDSSVDSSASTPRPSAFRVGLLSGCAASFSVQTCMFPVNSIKTRLQARPVGAAGRRVISRELFRGLYRGFVIDTLGSVPGTGVFMATYEALKSTRAVPAHVAAAGAALAGSLLSAPCDAIKQKMQVSAKRTLGAELHAIARSPRPLAAMFVGYPQFLARDLPFDTIQITTFEALRRWHARAVDPGRRDRTAAELALLGAAAGAFTGLVTTPMDVARTAEVCAMNAGLECRGAACLAQLVKTGGPKVLLRGAVPRMVEISVGGALYFSALERTKKALGWEADDEGGWEGEEGEDDGKGDAKKAR